MARTHLKAVIINAFIYVDRFNMFVLTYQHPKISPQTLNHTDTNKAAIGRSYL
jgi:hypothetical protein